MNSHKIYINMTTIFSGTFQIVLKNIYSFMNLTSFYISQSETP